MKLALAALVVAALWMLSGRRFRVEPHVPAALDDDQYVPMAAWDDADGLCPNCVTPWKCNGPHLIEDTAWYAAAKGGP